MVILHFVKPSLQYLASVEWNICCCVQFCEKSSTHCKYVAHIGQIQWSYGVFWH